VAGKKVEVTAALKSCFSSEEERTERAAQASGRASVARRILS
jgi:hypothetical protein